METERGRKLKIAIIHPDLGIGLPLLDVHFILGFNFEGSKPVVDSYSFIKT